MKCILNKIRSQLKRKTFWRNEGNWERHYLVYIKVNNLYKTAVLSKIWNGILMQYQNWHIALIHLNTFALLLRKRNIFEYLFCILHSHQENQITHGKNHLRKYRYWAEIEACTHHKPAGRTTQGRQTCLQTVTCAWNESFSGAVTRPCQKGAKFVAHFHLQTNYQWMHVLLCIWRRTRWYVCGVDFVARWSADAKMLTHV